MSSQIGANRLKRGAYASHPILDRENPEKFARRVDEYRRHFLPQGVEENFHMEVMVAAHEEIERVTYLESIAFAAAIGRVPKDSESPLAEALAEDYNGPQILEKLARRRGAAQSQWVRSNKLLKQFRDVRSKTEPAQPVAAGPQPVPSQTPTRPTPPIRPRS